MRRLFLRLTALGETTEDTRRRVPLAELLPEEGRGGGCGAGAAGSCAPLGGGRRLGRDRARGADPRVAEAARMAGGGPGRAPHPPAADDGCSHPGTRRAANDADLYRGPRLAAALELAGRSASLARRTRIPRREQRRADARADGCAAPRASTPYPARRRRGGAGGGVDRRILRPGSARAGKAHGDRRPGGTPRRAVARGRGEASRPGAAPRARGRPARRFGRHARRAARSARARLEDPRVAPGLRLARQRHGVQPRRKLLATATFDGTTLWDTATWKPVGPPLRSSQGGWRGSTSVPTGGRSRSRAERAASSCGTSRQRRRCGS